MRKRSVVTAVLFAMLAGCGNPQEKLKTATATENGGDYRAAAGLYARLVLETAPAHALPDAQKGKVMQPAMWQGETEKYLKWLTDPATAAPTAAGALRSALDGLDRCASRVEADNTANMPPPKTIDSLPAFTALWNAAFNPPPPGTIDWDAVVKNAFNKKLSILQISAPITYTYEVNIVSRKTLRRITFTLYPATTDTKSQITAPLPEGEYTIIVRSSVDFQKDQHWTSEYTAFPPTIISGTPSLIPIDLRTKVTRK